MTWEQRVSEEWIRLFQKNPKSLYLTCCFLADKEWIRLFQKNPAYPEQQSSYQIMIRPSFPQWYWKDEVPEQLPNNDDIAIVDETWKVGDKVDWLSEGSYWSAKITKLHNEDMVEVELFEPPIGEGQRYDANRNDLRPTLNWDLVDGWSVPISQAERKSWRVVRVIHRRSVETSDSGEETSSDDGDKGDNSGDGRDVQLQFLEANTSLEAPVSLIPKPSSAVTSDGVQPAVTSSQPGIGIILQERGMGSSIAQDQAGNVQGLGEIVGKLKELLERTLAMERRAACLGSFRWASDDASMKTR